MKILTTQHTHEKEASCSTVLLPPALSFPHAHKQTERHQTRQWYWENFASPAHGCTPERRVDTNNFDITASQQHNNHDTHTRTRGSLGEFAPTWMRSEEAEQIAYESIRTSNRRRTSFILALLIGRNKINFLCRACVSVVVANTTRLEASFMSDGLFKVSLETHLSDAKTTRSHTNP